VIKRHTLTIALTYSIYSLVLLALLNPFVFLKNDATMLGYGLIALSTFAFTYLLIRFIPSQSKRNAHHIVFVIGLYAIPLLNGCLIYLVNNQLESTFILYFSSFLILPIFPIAVYILWLLFEDLQARVTITTENRESTDEFAEKVFRIMNDKGILIKEIPLSAIIAFEAMDNYVITHYLDETCTLRKEMHRISLKKISELIGEISEDFLRVHKSHLVNPDYIVALRGKSQAYRIQLKHLDGLIPVSRTFNVDVIRVHEA
jgi:hypothetical protein